MDFNQELDSMWEKENRIAQLEADLAVGNKCINSLRLSLGKARLRNGDHEANLVELNNQLADVRKDQERYRFVRDMTPEDFGNMSTINEDFDSQVDAAIKEQGK